MKFDEAEERLASKTCTLLRRRHPQRISSCLNEMLADSAFPNHTIMYLLSGNRESLPRTVCGQSECRRHDVTGRERNLLGHPHLRQTCCANPVSVKNDLLKMGRIVTGVTCVFSSLFTIHFFSSGASSSGNNILVCRFGAVKAVKIASCEVVDYISMLFYDAKVGTNNSRGLL